jgi:oligoribonuclease (3'-5' exoribonuclease)
MTEYQNNPFSFWMRGATLEVWSEQMGIPLTDDKPEFAWVDIETSGLDRRFDRIFELGIVLTNAIGEVCRTGIIDWRVFIHDPDDERYPEYRKALMRAEDNVIVRDMHIKSGLIKDIMNDARHPESWKAHPSTVQVQARNWLAEVTGLDESNKGLQLSGSSPHFDRGFLQDHMVYLEDWFHYRSGVDVSGQRETFKRVNFRVIATQPQKCEKHRPIPDLADSIRLYRHMLKTGYMLDYDVRERIGAEDPVDEIDRNARAYGYEVGRGAALSHGMIQTSDDNPFMAKNWRAQIGIL